MSLIPIQRDQPTATATTLDKPVFVIGPKPVYRPNIMRSLPIRVFDALWQTGLAMGALAFVLTALALVWPSFGRYLEQFGWFVGHQVMLIVNSLT
jgi:hypothetical protein